MDTLQRGIIEYNIRTVSRESSERPISPEMESLVLVENETSTADPEDCDDLDQLDIKQELDVEGLSTVSRSGEPEPQNQPSESPEIEILVLPKDVSYDGEYSVIEVTLDDILRDDGIEGVGRHVGAPSRLESDSSACEASSPAPRDCGDSDLFDLRVVMIDSQSDQELNNNGSSAAEDSYAENSQSSNQQVRPAVPGITFSKSVNSKICLHKSRFFHSLPLQKQITLLQRSKDLPQGPGSKRLACSMLAQELAVELKLSYNAVFSWLRRRYMTLQKVGTTLSPRHIKYLVEEFNMSPVLSQERALLLGHILRAPVGTIHRWFKLKRMGRLRLYRSSASRKDPADDSFKIIEDGVSDEVPESPVRGDPTGDRSARRRRRTEKGKHSSKGADVPGKCPSED